jgi:hypothetical protein
VPEHVPANAPETGAFARSPERMLELVSVKQASAWSSKNEFTLEVPMSTKRVQDFAAERDLARASVLRRADAVTAYCSHHDESSRNEIDIVPPKGHQLTQTKTAPEGDHEDRLALRLRRTPKSLS